MVETEIVKDRNGVKKKITGRPTGLRDWSIPTGEKDLDGRCPNCGEVGFWRYHGSHVYEAICTNDDCRVSKFSMFVEEEE